MSVRLTLRAAPLVRLEAPSRAPRRVRDLAARPRSRGFPPGTARSRRGSATSSTCRAARPTTCASAGTSVGSSTWAPAWPAAGWWSEVAPGLHAGAGDERRPAAHRRRRRRLDGRRDARRRPRDAGQRGRAARGRLRGERAGHDGRRRSWSTDAVGDHAGERLRRGSDRRGGRRRALRRARTWSRARCWSAAASGRGRGRRPEARHDRGGRRRSSCLPTFRYACRYRPGFLALLFRSLEARGFPVPGALRDGASSTATAATTPTWGAGRSCNGRRVDGGALRLNERAAAIADAMVEDAAVLRVSVSTLEGGARLIDCGIDGPGGPRGGPPARRGRAWEAPGASSFTTVDCDGLRLPGRAGPDRPARARVPRLRSTRAGPSSPRATSPWAPGRCGPSPGSKSRSSSSLGYAEPAAGRGVLVLETRTPPGRRRWPSGSPRSPASPRIG